MFGEIKTGWKWGKIYPFSLCDVLIVPNCLSTFSVKVNVGTDIVKSQKISNNNV